MLYALRLDVVQVEKAACGRNFYSIYHRSRQNQHIYACFAWVNQHERKKTTTQWNHRKEFVWRKILIEFTHRFELRQCCGFLLNQLCVFTTYFNHLIFWALFETFSLSFGNYLVVISHRVLSTLLLTIFVNSFSSRPTIDMVCIFVFLFSKYHRYTCFSQFLRETFSFRWRTCANCTFAWCIPS